MYDNDNEIIFISIHLHIHIYMLQTMEIRKSQEIIDLYIWLSHFLQQYHTASLYELIESIVSKCEYYVRH